MATTACADRYKGIRIKVWHPLLINVLPQDSSRSYWMCGHSLQSNIALPELLASEAKAADYRITVHQPGPLPIVSHWIDKQRDLDGNAWYLCTKVGSMYLIRILEMVDFLIDETEGKLDCYPNLDVPVETIRHLLLDHILPRLFNRKLYVTLHGSAVATSAGAIAFLGTSGQGKSTLATSFAYAGQRLLTDDCVAVQKQGNAFSLLPSYPGIRAWADTAQTYAAANHKIRSVAHYTKKHRIDLTANPDAFSMSALPLYRLYILTEPTHSDNTITIRPLAPQAALIQLVRHTYRLDASNPAQLSREFTHLSNLVESCAVFQLGYPRDYGQLPAVQRAILNQVTNSSISPSATVYA